MREQLLDGSEPLLKVIRGRELDTLLGEVIQRCRKAREIWQEFAEIIGQRQEREHLLPRLRKRPIEQSLYLGRVRLNTLFGQDVPQILDLLLEEVTLGALRKQAVLPKGLKNKAEVGQMLRSRFRQDQNVIQIYEKEIKLRKDGRHDPREGGWGIGEAHDQNRPLKVPERRGEGCLRNISLSDLDLVIPLGQIQRREALSTPSCIKQIIDARQREPIFDRDFIESTIIQTAPQTSVLFLHKENRSPIGRSRWPDEALSQKGSDLFLEFSKLERGEPEHAPIRRSMTWLQRNRI